MRRMIEILADQGTVQCVCAALAAGNRRLPD
jgi:hypothetical protein